MRPTTVLAPRFCARCPFLGRCDHDLDGCDDWHEAGKPRHLARMTWLDVPGRGRAGRAVAKEGEREVAR